MEWINVFGNNVVEWAIGIAITIALFRLISRGVKLLNQTESMTYIIKVFIYGMLVAYMVAIEKPNKISVYDGFTLVFAIIELVDNFILFILDWLSLKFVNDIVKAEELFDKKNEEEVFLNLISKLWKLRTELTAGKIDKSIRNKLVEIIDIYRESDFRMIDKIIEYSEGEERTFSKCMNEILKLKIVPEILDSEYRGEQSKYYERLYINCIHCNELKELLDRAIHCSDIYRMNLIKLKTLDDSLGYMLAIRKIECDKISGLKYEIWKKNQDLKKQFRSC